MWLSDKASLGSIPSSSIPKQTKKTLCIVYISFSWKEMRKVFVGWARKYHELK